MNLRVHTLSDAKPTQFRKRSNQPTESMYRQQSTESLTSQLSPRLSPYDLVTYLSVLAEEMDLQVLAPQKMKGGLITCTSATVGGVCAGPLGLLLGGMFGGTVAAYTCKPQVMPVKDILSSLPRDQRQRLYQSFEKTLFDEDLHRVRSFQELSTRLARDLDTKHVIQNKLKEVVQLEWNLVIHDPRVARVRQKITGDEV